MNHRALRATSCFIKRRVIIQVSASFGHIADDKEETKPTPVSHPTMYTVPNAITICRICASPGISYLIFNGSWNAALTGLCVAGASDWLDGYIARNYDQMSPLGSILDPIADKLLVGAVAIPLALNGHLPMWLLGLTLARDLGLVVGFIWMGSYGEATTPRTKIKHVIKKGMEDIRTPLSTTAPSGQGFSERMIEVRPSYLSKANTALQVSLLGLTMMHAGWGVVPSLAIDTLTIATAATTIASGVDYYINAKSVMRINDLEK